MSRDVRQCEKCGTWVSGPNALDANDTPHDCERPAVSSAHNPTEPLGEWCEACGLPWPCPKSGVGAGKPEESAGVPPKRCPSRFTAWFDGHQHVVQCQKDAGHEDEFHNHERRWMDGEDLHV